MKKAIYVVGFIATFMTTTGLLFQFLHWKGAAFILIMAVVLINFGFLPMFFYHRYKRSESV
ncbi:MAG: hypothetical protein H7321_09360 [Bacteroidia bacterium]|nr:hypothetical protein [Bacteroidia bacterium]